MWTVCFALNQYAYACTHFHEMRMSSSDSTYNAFRCLAAQRLRIGSDYATGHHRFAGRPVCCLETTLAESCQTDVTSTRDADRLGQLREWSQSHVIGTIHTYIVTVFLVCSGARAMLMSRLCALQLSTETAVSNRDHRLWRHRNYTSCVWILRRRFSITVTLQNSMSVVNEWREQLEMIFITPACQLVYPLAVYIPGGAIVAWFSFMFRCQWFQK